MQSQWVVFIIAQYFFLILTARGRLYTSESDVCRRQILTYKDGPRAEKNTIFLVAVDP